MMTVNKAATIQSMIEHKDIFFRMLDHSQQLGNSGGVTFIRSMYEGLTASKGELMARHDRDKMFNALSVENLVACDLTIYEDPQSGSFMLQECLVDVLRLLEVDRMRTLSSADLDMLHDQIANVHGAIKHHEVLWIDTDLDFQERVRATHEMFRTVASKLSQNVTSIRNHANRLSDIVDSTEYEKLSQTEQFTQALGELLTIYQRNIIPTMKFLDERLDIKKHDGKPPMLLMAEIQERFEQSKRYSDSKQIRRIIVQMLSLAEQVKETKESLTTYINLAKEQRRRYNKIEERYNRLHDAAKDMLDGRLKGYVIKADNPLFHGNERFIGLKQRARDKHLIDLPKDDLPRAYQEYRRVRLDKIIPSSTPMRQAKRDPASSKEKRERDLQISRMKSLLSSFDIDESGDDLAIQLHDFLQDKLPGYDLSCLVDAFMLIKTDEMMISSIRLRQIKFKNQEYSYYPISVPVLEDGVVHES